MVNNGFHSDEIAHCVSQCLARRTAISVTGVYDTVAVDALFQFADAVPNLRLRTTFAVGPADTASKERVSCEANVLLLCVVAD